jgi:predicted metalloendopeptidase
MTPATKKEALVKLHAVTEKIGYPDRWRDTAGSRSSAATRSATRACNAPEFHRR